MNANVVFGFLFVIGAIVLVILAATGKLWGGDVPVGPRTINVKLKNTGSACMDWETRYSDGTTFKEEKNKCHNKSKTLSLPVDGSLHIHCIGGHSRDYPAYVIKDRCGYTSSTTDCTNTLNPYCKIVSGKYEVRGI